MMGLWPLRVGRLCSESLTYAQLMGEPTKIPWKCSPHCLERPNGSDR